MLVMFFRCLTQTIHVNNMMIDHGLFWVPWSHEQMKFPESSPRSFHVCQSAPASKRMKASVRYNEKNSSKKNMKITQIDCHVLLDPGYDVGSTSSSQDDIVVEIHTDEGVTGHWRDGRQPLDCPGLHSGSWHAHDGAWACRNVDRPGPLADRKHCGKSSMLVRP